MRVALGLSYRGAAYGGWQSQPHGNTIQDQLEKALASFLGTSARVVCAGRTDAGVHAVNQVVHLDAPVERSPMSWVRGTNRFLPRDIAVQWARPVADGFDARRSARGRRYAYLMLESPNRPGLEHGLCGWTFRPLDQEAMRRATELLIGEHDFSAMRSSQCQASTPIRIVHAMGITRQGAYWRFDFDANAFLHHMVRNIVGCLVAVGNGSRSVAWLADVMAARERSRAAPTFAPDGLYFLGPYYDPAFTLPDPAPAVDWLPRG